MRYYVITALTIVAVLFVSTLAMAQQYGYGAGMMGSQSGLTLEKQTAFNTLRNEHWKTIMPLNLDLRAKQAELDSLLVAPKINNAKVKSVREAINALHGKILAEKTDFRRKAFETTGYLMNGYGHGSSMSGMKGMSGMKCMSGMKGKGGGGGYSQSGMHMMMQPNMPMMAPATTPQTQ